MGLLKNPSLVVVVYGFVVLLLVNGKSSVVGIGVNWGTQSTHPVPPSVVVKMLRDNGIQKVKLFDADSTILQALANSGIQVMVGIPNDMLYRMSNSLKAAENWVSKNLSSHVSNGVDVRYVAVGNEPFLSAYNGSFLGTTFPALRNVQSAVAGAGLTSRVKVTIPLNADVYGSSSNLPSTGDFRADIKDLMLEIVKFLSDNGAPFTVNIYPFISLHADPNFPLDFAFFDGFTSPINDNGRIYQNVLDANHDTLVWALQKNGFETVPIVIGEIGWPTNGDAQATLQLAQRFNQGFLTRFNAGTGTPMRPGAMDVYLFSLIDEDAKSIQPGNFERHWGLFYYDGTPKYTLNLGTTTTSSNGLVPASGLGYLAKKWCILSPTGSLDDPELGPSVSYACSHADCTSLGYGTSCAALDARGNVSYAFNNYYQISDQLETACQFPNNLSVITDQDPSVGDCLFKIMINVPSSTTINRGGSSTGVGGAGHLESKPICVIISVLVILSMIL